MKYDFSDTPMALLFDFATALRNHPPDEQTELRVRLAEWLIKYRDKTTLGPKMVTLIWKAIKLEFEYKRHEVLEEFLVILKRNHAPKVFSSLGDD